MFGFDGAAKTDKTTLDAIRRSLAIIEFDPTGKILSANENLFNKPPTGPDAGKFLQANVPEPQTGGSTANPPGEKK